MFRHFTLMQAALGCGVVGLAVLVSGCLMAAAELAPAAIQLVASAGSGIAHVAEASIISAHEEKADKSMPAPDSDVCDELSLDVPMLVEFRTDAAGTTHYRELGLGGDDLDPQWEPMPSRDGKDGGWKSASNFTKMDFQPPLQSELSSNSITYIAYAASDARDATEQDQLNALEIGFGPDAGTFKWNQRVFRYAVAHKLPCFPPPPDPKP